MQGESRTRAEREQSESRATPPIGRHRCLHSVPPHHKNTHTHPHHTQHPHPPKHKRHLESTPTHTHTHTHAGFARRFERRGQMTAAVRVDSTGRSWLGPPSNACETVILLHPPLPLAGVSIVMERERQQNDSLVNAWPTVECVRVPQPQLTRLRHDPRLPSRPIETPTAPRGRPSIETLLKRLLHWRWSSPRQAPGKPQASPAAVHCHASRRFNRDGESVSADSDCRGRSG